MGISYQNKESAWVMMLQPILELNAMALKVVGLETKVFVHRLEHHIHHCQHMESKINRIKVAH